MVAMDHGTKRKKQEIPVVHEIELQRGWRLEKERLEVTVAMEEKVLWGAAIITMVALNEEFEEVRLNLRRCEVSVCYVNEQSTPFEMHSPLDDRVLLNAVSSETMRHRLYDIEVELDKRTEEAEDGELVVVIPESVKKDLKKDLYGTSKTEQPKRPLDTYPRFTVRVDFRTADASVGAVFYNVTERNKENAKTSLSYVVTDGRHGLARCWMPCVDSPLWCDKCPWELEVVANESTMVVASGELVGTRLLSVENDGLNRLANTTAAGSHEASEKHSKKVGENKNGHNVTLSVVMKRYLFRLDLPAHASEVAMAAGPFRALPDPQSPANVTHFCLPGSARKLVHTSAPLYAVIMKFYREYLGADPLISSFKQLFLAPGHGSGDPFCAAGGLAIYSGEFLHTDRDIEEAFEARMVMAKTLCEAYFGRLVRPRSPEDAWLVNGLVAYVSSLALRSILGNNWYRHYIFDLVNEMIEEPQEAAARLSKVSLGRPVDSFSLSAVRRAHIIVHMVSKRVGPEVLRRALRDLVAEAREDAEGFTSTRASAFGFDDATKGLGVAFFLKRLRSICNIDVRTVVRIWATSLSHPQVHYGYRYNPRRNVIEFVAKQPPFKSLKSTIAYDNRAVSKYPALNPPIPLTGTLTVRVSEVDGTYDHAVEIRDAITVTELPCHSRRSKTKASLRDDKEGTTDQDPVARTPINYVIVDPELEHPCKQVFLQPQRALLLLLKYERDAVAQDIACSGLARFATPECMDALAKALCDSHLYWRVRATAANALACCPNGLQVLLKCFRDLFAMDSSLEEDQLAPNDFKDIASYFVKKAIIKAISAIRSSDTTEDGDIIERIHPVALSFLIRLLQSNDNSSNAFSDRHFVAFLLRCAAEASSDERVLGQLKRYIDLHSLNPDPIVHSALVDALYAMERPRIESSAGQTELFRLRFKPNETVLSVLAEAVSCESHFFARRSAFRVMLRLYGTDLEVLIWVLSKVDRTLSGSDIIEMWRKRGEERCTQNVEYPRIRLAAVGAIASMLSYQSLRRHSKRAMQICVRILRICVGDPDARIRCAAIDLAAAVYGTGIPVCLLTERQYHEHAKSARTQAWARESQGLGLAGSQRRVGYRGRRSAGHGIEGSPLGLKHGQVNSEDPFGLGTTGKEKVVGDPSGSPLRRSAEKNKNPLLALKPIRIPVSIPKLVPKDFIDRNNLPDYDQEDIEYMVQVFQQSDGDAWRYSGIDSPLLESADDHGPFEDGKERKRGRTRDSGGRKRKKKKKKKKKRRAVDKRETGNSSSVIDLTGAPLHIGGTISGSEGAGVRPVGNGSVKLKIKLPMKPRI